MLLVFLFLSLFLSSANQALPISERATPPSVLDVETNKRSMFNIIWSCIVTTILCGWVSVHPDIGPYKQGGSRFERSLRNFWKRSGLLLFTVVVPETIVVWAAMEYFAADKIEREYKKKGWTRAHGHLVEMGGFARCRPALTSTVKVDNKDVDDRHIETLTYERFKELLNKSSIEFPTITECEIQDRSKGDVVAKTFAAIQTSWFVLQCIVRHQQGLAITELELTTLALAALNGIVLWLWKDKPLDMGVQVPVYSKERSEGNTVEDEGKEEVAQEVDRAQQGRLTKWLKRVPESEAIRIKGWEEERKRLRKERGLANDDRKDLGLSDLYLVSAWLFFRVVAKDLISMTIGKWRSESGLVRLTVLSLMLPLFFLVSTLVFALGTPAALILFFLIRIAAKFFPVDKYYSRLITAVSAGDGKDVLIYPRLFQEENGYALSSVFIGIQAGVIFGGLHCAGWNFIFPTSAEKTIWRLMSLAITLLPFLGQLLAFAVLMTKNLFWLYVDSDDSEIVTAGSPLLLHGYICLGSLCAIMYLVARISLIALALAALREQPPSAYVAVKWTKLLRP